MTGKSVASVHYGSIPLRKLRNEPSLWQKKHLGATMLRIRAMRRVLRLTEKAPDNARDVSFLSSLNLFLFDSY